MNKWTIVRKKKKSVKYLNDYETLQEFRRRAGKELLRFGVVLVLLHWEFPEFCNPFIFAPPSSSAITSGTFAQDEFAEFFCGVIGKLCLRFKSWSDSMQPLLWPFDGFFPAFCCKERNLCSLGCWAVFPFPEVDAAANRKNN